MLKKWDALPKEMQNEKVRPYYEALQKKKFNLLLKRLFLIPYCLDTAYALTFLNHFHLNPLEFHCLYYT